MYLEEQISNRFWSLISRLPKQLPEEDPVLPISVITLAHNIEMFCVSEMRTRNEPVWVILHELSISIRCILDNTREVMRWELLPHCLAAPSIGISTMTDLMYQLYIVKAKFFDQCRQPLPS